MDDRGPEERFAHDWLSLREPVDHRSRSAALVDVASDWWEEVGAARVLDLGCGTGSNLRYLAPRLPSGQRWTLLDHDEDLLRNVRADGLEVELITVLGALDAEGLAAVRKADLVTASALLDLVSEIWLGDLVATCVEGGRGALFALSYDGGIEWASGGGSERDRGFVRDAVNAHQRRDKGVGAALGPVAGFRAADLFRRHGYRTWVHPSPWTLGADDAALANALVEGWVQAATEVHPDETERLRAWGAERERSILSGEFEVRVGHVDVLALPASSDLRVR